MADYLLDTMILRYWYDDRCPEHAAVLKHVQHVREPDPDTGYVSRLFVSVVTRSEIEYGHRVELTPDLTTQREYIKFINEQLPETLEITHHVSEPYGNLRAWIFNNCSPKNKRSRAKRAEELVHPTTAKELGIDENDLWIAAQAVTYNLLLVTHDRLNNLGNAIKHVTPALKLEDWANL